MNNEYAERNVAHLIAGYLLPRPHEGADSVEAFERAKGELIEVMQARIALITAMSFQLFKRRIDAHSRGHHEASPKPENPPIQQCRGPGW